MFRKILVAASASALALAGVGMATVGTASAGKPTVTMPGNAHVSCTITKGKVKISPGLTNVPTQQTVTVKVKTTCTGAAFQGVSPTGAKFTGSITGGPPGTCASLLAESTTPINFTAKWKGSGGKINPSVVKYTTYKGSATSFDAPGPTGHSVITGSYGGTATSSAHGTIGSIKGDCSSKKPIKGITLSGGTLHMN